MPLYEFRCENEKCPAVNEVVEVEVKLADLYTVLTECERCGEKMVRLMSKLRTKHGSWNRWNV
jgi:putative FmdB family regulatory protein